MFQVWGAMISITSLTDSLHFLGRSAGIKGCPEVKIEVFRWRLYFDVRREKSSLKKNAATAPTSRHVEAMAHRSRKSIACRS